MATTRSALLAALLIVAGGGLAPRPAVADNKRASALFTMASQENRDRKSRYRALQHINEAIKLDPNNADYWWLKSTIYICMEEQEEALPCIDKAIAIRPNAPRYYMDRADILARIGRNKEAITAADKALAIDSSAEAYTAKGNVLTALNDLPGAEKCFDQALKLDPKSQLPRIHRCRVARILHHWEKALEDVNIIIGPGGANVGSDVTNHRNRAEIYTELKKYDLAKADFFYILNKVHDDRQSHAGLLKIYRLTGNRAGEEKEIKKLKDLDSDFIPL